MLCRNLILGIVLATPPTFCLSQAATHSAAPTDRGTMPADAPPAWKPLIGEYGTAEEKVYVLESHGTLVFRSHDHDESLRPQVPNRFKLASQDVVFDARQGQAPAAVRIGDKTYPRLPFSAVSGGIFRISPLRPIPDLTRQALSEQPPAEKGDFLPADLVEVINLDPSVKLDIRYATSNNFLSTPVYSEARAFLQRPAAEAVARANQELKPLGYGLLIHDAYRPWYVTKVFWDATPNELRKFVADPSQVSRHNRGCAVDITLYDLNTGSEIEMTGVYDEMSDRSYADYPGGTTRQRWHRDLLRRVMEDEGFAVNKYEWWHFDYKDWQKYPILNLRFDLIQPRQASKPKQP